VAEVVAVVVVVVVCARAGAANAMRHTAATANVIAFI